MTQAPEQELTVHVLDEYGMVTLIDSMGDDLRIVNAARVSLAKESFLVQWCNYCDCEAAEPSIDANADRCYDSQGLRFHNPENLTDMLKASDAGLIGFLMNHRHGTPFEKVYFEFRVRCPIGVAREWQRHRIGSFNEESTRYVDMRPDFYLPKGDAIRSQVGKPGRYTYEPIVGVAYTEVTRLMEAAYVAAYDYYQRLMGAGLAREVARNVLPLGLYTEFMWTVNLRSLFNFLSLRAAPTALHEIQAFAGAVYTLAVPVAPIAFGHWETNGRPAP